MLKQTMPFLLSTLFIASLLALFSMPLMAQVDEDAINKNESTSDVELFAQAVQFSLQQQWAKAEPIYRKLIARNSEWPEPANNLAILLLKTNRIDEAKLMFEQAVVSSPNYRVAQNNRSELYNFLATQAYDKALGAKTKVSEPDLELIETIYHPVKVIEIEVEKIIIKKEIIEVAVPAEKAPSLDVVNSEVDGSDVDGSDVDGSGAASLDITTSEANGSENKLIEERIKRQLIVWSRAWSRGDFEYYIQNYSADFQPSDASQSYIEWKNIRRAKLKFTKGVNVEIENIRVFLEPLAQYALVEFIQNYQSSSYRDRVLKQMYMSRQHGSWIILSERTIKTYKK